MQWMYPDVPQVRRRTEWSCSQNNGTWLALQNGRPYKIKKNLKTVEEVKA